ncbi:Sodium/hydrogen exchanger 1 [Lucilia cuprina]|nr:Sodium/hydrogen exchanger 1 [Lucilia cuprina]
MFYDLLTRNSNEYFYQGPAGRKKGERAKHEHEAEEKEFINFFSKQQQNTFGPQETRQKLERAANKMAVNKKKQTIMMASQDEREESKDKKTPSLEQEMNLARRACWCNNNLDDLKGQQQEQQIKQKCCENCFKRLNKDNIHDNDNVNEKENVINDKNEENDDDDEEDDDVNETTVLNGAKNFSKNINKLNKTTNNDNTNTTTTTTTINSNSKMFSNTNTNTTTNSLSKRKNLINKHKMETGNETTTISSSSTISKDAAANNSSVSDSASFPTTVNNNATNCNNSLSNNNNNNNNFTAYLRVVLLQLWLAFVEFCDKNTIKKNDPRFAPYRPTDQKQDQQKSQQQQQQNSTPNNSSSTKAKKPFQFKLLTNKKIIFLFIVCVFFSCVNRIEARPNLESSNNAIVGEASPGVVASSNDGGANVKAMDNSVSGKSNSPVADSSIPPSHNDVHNNYNAHAAHEARSDDGEEEGGHHDRYPLAQVEFDRVKTPFIIGVWILSASIAKIGFHMTPKLHLIFPESCLLIVVGVVIGVVLFFCTDVAVSPLTPNTFFFYMLPPIILDAGYFMPNRLFFDNLGTILLMAVVVMYHMMEVYNHIGISEIIAQDVVNGVGSFFVVAIGGTVIGIIWGFLTGLVTRFTDHVRVIEPIFIFVMAYLAYLNAEIFHMSGILAITFCGITMKNYVESNISQKSHTTVKYALKMISSSSETVIFMFLGVATVNNNHVWNTWFVVLTILFCSFFRVIGVIVLSAIANRFRLHKLSRVDQFVMSYGGLRGAVAFALVLLIDERVVPTKNMFVTTTIAVIYFTVFVQGITIKPLVKILNVKRANKRKPTMNERIHERFMDHLMAGIEDIIGKTGNYNVRDKFKRFDNRFIRPLLIRDLKGAEPKIIETYSKLTMRDAIEVMRRNPSTIGQITGTESMSALFRNYTNNCIGGSPSLTNLDNTCSRNLDMHELDYNPSKKDLTDARIHHLLAEELKPYRRVNYKMQMNFRRMFNDRKHHKRSKRGASKHQDGVKQNHVSFHDFQQNGTTKQFSHGTSKNETNLRKKLIRKHSHNSLNKYRRLEIVLSETVEENPNKLTEVTVVGANDDWDDGLTFTAKSSPDSDRANNNSLIAHIQNLPGFDASKARIVQHYAAPSSSQHDSSCESPEKLLSPDDPPIGPTAAELILPWRRDRSYQSIVAENAIPEEDRNLRDSGDERRVATPTATESQLPWKRQGDEISDAVQQNEFPAWASNKEYLAYNSPSATFLGGINKPKQPKSVIGLFRRESSGSRGGNSIGGNDGLDGACSARGSDPALAAALSSMVVPSTAYNPRLDKRSQSISSGSGISEGHSGPFPVTASHRRNVRRGSMLELSGDNDSNNDDDFNNASNELNTSNTTSTTTTTSTSSTANTDTIPEESYYHGHSKSLCEPAGEEWESVLADAEKADYASGNSDKLLKASSGREPLLPKLTPRAQIRRNMGGAMGGSNKKNQVTTALLSSTNSDYDDDEEEDFDLYDENIVVTTTTNEPSNRLTRPGLMEEQLHPNTTTNTTTTSIRLTRNNDEKNLIEVEEYNEEDDNNDDDENDEDDDIEKQEQQYLLMGSRKSRNFFKYEIIKIKFSKHIFAFSKKTKIIFIIIIFFFYLIFLNNKINKILNLIYIKRKKNIYFIIKNKNPIYCYSFYLNKFFLFQF